VTNAMAVQPAATRYGGKDNTGRRGDTFQDKETNYVRVRKPIWEKSSEGPFHRWPCSRSDSTSQKVHRTVQKPRGRVNPAVKRRHGKKARMRLPTSKTCRSPEGLHHTRKPPWGTSQENRVPRLFTNGGTPSVDGGQKRGSQGGGGDLGGRKPFPEVDRVTWGGPLISVNLFG